MFVVSWFPETLICDYQISFTNFDLRYWRHTINQMQSISIARIESPFTVVLFEKCTLYLVWWNFTQFPPFWEQLLSLQWFQVTPIRGTKTCITFSFFMNADWIFATLIEMKWKEKKISLFITPFFLFRDKRDLHLYEFRLHRNCRCVVCYAKSNVREVNFSTL